ncbi:hypothetical protein [Rhodoplanes sp. SY1]|uniref:hypothetical protein n=1 Tax=Rhodoplanes sp. SY1 TaxID=3166646 RepID=UPI0038B68EBD
MNLPLPVELSLTTLLIIAIAGGLAAWKAEHAGVAPGFGLFGDAVVGIFGAFDGVWALQAKWGAGTGPAATAAAALVGAAVLLFVARQFAIWWNRPRPAARPTPAVAVATGPRPERPVARAARAGR